MTTLLQRKGLLASVEVAGLGVLSTAVWLGEVVLLKGWDGLQWLDGYPHSAFVGIACVVLSVVLACRVVAKATVTRTALFVVIAYAISLASFELARFCLYELHSRSAAFMAFAGEPDMAWSFTVKNLAGLAGSALVAALGFGFAARLLLTRVRWWLPAVYLLALALVMPMGLLTIWVVPALNGNTDYLHVVKMGYPLFWTNVLMALGSWIGARACAR